jgi:hypothetical protein
MRILIMALLFTLTSCAGWVATNYRQECAQKGMKLAGVNSGSGASYNYNYGRTNHYSENVQCELPKSKKEQCEINAYERSLDPIYEYNEWWRTKDAVTGLGYFAFILPGVGAKMYFESKQEDAIAESRRIAQEELKKCEMAEERAPASPPAPISHDEDFVRP